MTSKLTGFDPRSYLLHLKELEILKISSGRPSLCKQREYLSGLNIILILSPIQFFSTLYNSYNVIKIVFFLFSDFPYDVKSAEIFKYIQSFGRKIWSGQWNKYQVLEKY